jgi:hypothetical protein
MGQNSEVSLIVLSKVACRNSFEIAARQGRCSFEIAAGGGFEITAGGSFEIAARLGRGSFEIAARLGRGRGAAMGHVHRQQPSQSTHRLLSSLTGVQGGNLPRNVACWLARKRSPFEGGGFDAESSVGAGVTGRRVSPLGGRIAGLSKASLEICCGIRKDLVPALDWSWPGSSMFRRVHRCPGGRRSLAPREIGGRGTCALTCALAGSQASSGTIWTAQAVIEAAVASLRGLWPPASAK